MSKLTLNEIARRSHETSKEKGWWEGKLDPKDRSFVPEKLMLIVSEASEALESYRKGEPLSCYRCDVAGEETIEIVNRHPNEPNGVLTTCPDHQVRAKPEGMASELADIVIRVGDLAERLGINLGQAVEEKHAYNLTRSHKHGGKVC